MYLGGVKVKEWVLERWNGFEEIEFGCCQVVNVKKCRMERMRGLDYVEELIVEKCDELVGIGSLMSVRRLMIERCDNLRFNFVDGMGRNLERVYVENCDELEDMGMLDECVGLKCVEFVGCRNLRNIGFRFFGYSWVVRGCDAYVMGER